MFTSIFLGVILAAYLFVGYLIFIIIEGWSSTDSYEDSWRIRDSESRFMSMVFWPLILALLALFAIMFLLKSLGKMFKIKSFEKALYTAIHNLKKSMNRKNKS